MAIRAALSPPKEDQSRWDWHEAKWNALPASILSSKDRRMEAENYLSGGYGIRLSMDSRTMGRGVLSDLARVWQPSRLKGILVSKDYGTPFLAATQVFDLRPAPRKYLSIERTDSAADRMVAPGQIMITCSGSVGRATLATDAHVGKLISHDLLRITPHSAKYWGWLYAFLRSPQGRAMMGAAQYGHIIKHLEVGHIDVLPVPIPLDEIAERFQEKVGRILELRNSSYRATTDAEGQYQNCFPSFKKGKATASGFSVKANAMFEGRRRLEASRFVPEVGQIDKAFLADAKSVEPLLALTKKIFVPGRFKHIYGDGGMPYLDSADILEVNPDISKFVLSLTEKEQIDYHVEPGWLLIPCSGQVYGNLGHSVLATDAHVGRVYTNHLLRVVPNGRARSGYLQCVLGHQILGRPQIIRLAFGSSVPELSPDEVATVQVPRLGSAIENRLADLMDEAAVARDEADELERQVAHDAEALIDKFLSGDRSLFTKL